MDWFADVVALGALLWAGFTWFDARRSAKRAEGDAARALQASIDSADAARRSAAAAEHQLALATPPAIAFRIDPVAGIRYALRNVGTQRTTGVTIVTEQPSAFVDPPVEVDLEPGEAAPFMARGTNRSPMPVSAPVRCSELDKVIHVPMP